MIIITPPNGGIIIIMEMGGIFFTRRSHTLRVALSSFRTRVFKNVKTFTFLEYPSIPSIHTHNYNNTP